MDLLRGIVWQAAARSDGGVCVSSDARVGGHGEGEGVEFGGEGALFLAVLQRGAHVGGTRACLELQFVDFAVPREGCLELAALVVPDVVLLLGHRGERGIQGIVFCRSCLPDRLRLLLDTFLAQERNV